MTVNNVFYKAGTSQKVTLKSNVTLTDIDTRQYIGVSASKIDGQYVSNNTTLSYLKNGNKNFYYAITAEKLKQRLDLSLKTIHLFIPLDVSNQKNQQIRNSM